MSHRTGRKLLGTCWGPVQSVAMVMVVVMVLGDTRVLGRADSTTPVMDGHMRESTNQLASSGEPSDLKIAEEKSFTNSNFSTTNRTTRAASTKLKITAPFKYVPTAPGKSTIGLIATAQLGSSSTASMVSLGKGHPTLRLNTGVVTLRPTNTLHRSGVSTVHTARFTGTKQSTFHSGSTGYGGVGRLGTTFFMSGIDKGHSTGRATDNGAPLTVGGSPWFSTTPETPLQSTTQAGRIRTQGPPTGLPTDQFEPPSTPPPMELTSASHDIIRSTFRGTSIGFNEAPSTVGSIATSPHMHSSTAQPPTVTTGLSERSRTTDQGTHFGPSTTEGPITEGFRATTNSPMTRFEDLTSPTGADSSEVEAGEVTIVRRQATTALDTRAGNCSTPVFKESGGGDYSYIQPLDDIEPYTRLVLEGVGLGGNHTWNLTRVVEPEDPSLFVNFGKRLIPGEEYLITRRWCTNETCQDGECPPFGPVKKEFQFRDFDTITLIEADVTAAVFRWSIQREAYLPRVRFLLNLTNDGTAENRTGGTFNTTGPYSTEGLFVVSNLTSGARYIMKFHGRADGIPFVTAPAEPGEVEGDQITYNTANFTWQHAGFADNFTFTYGEMDGLPMTVVVLDSSFQLGNLSFNTTYNISVYAQTAGHLSPPANLIFTLNPPSLGIEVIHQATTRIEVIVYLPEILREFQIYANRVEKVNLPILDMSRIFNITDLTPGENQRLKFVFKTGEFTWQQKESVATKPLPPSSLTVDNSDYGWLDVCWAPPTDGGYDRYRITFNTSGSVKTKHLSRMDLCHLQRVEGGVHYVISMVTMSNGLESVAKWIETVSAPAPPTIDANSKSTSTVSLNVSCPTDGSSDYVYYSLCPLGSEDCSLMDGFPCGTNGTSQSIWQEGLTPGECYQFKAKSSRVIDDSTAYSDIVSYNFTTYPLPPSLLSAPKITGLEITLTWVSDCLHCTFIIEAVPHREMLETILEVSSCEDRLHDRCESSLVVEPEEFYDIIVTSRAWGEESLVGTRLHNISMPTAIKHVTDIQLESLTPTVVSLNFAPPEVPRERITHYVVQYHGRRENGDSCSQAHKWLQSNVKLPTNFTVRGGCLYNFTIEAFFGPINGGIAWGTIQTETGVLKPTTQQPRYPGQFTHRSFTVTFDPRIFDDEFGPVENFTVVVAEAIAVTEQLSAPQAMRWSLPGWAESIGRDPIPPYQAFPESPVYDFTGGISKRSVDVERRYTIGTEDCGEDSPRYCNGYLIGGKSYVYWFRGYNEAGFTDTKPSSEFPLPKNQSSLIIGCLVILMILFLIVVILAALLLKKRLHMDDKGAYQPAQADGVHLKALTRKTSTRAKYIRSIKLSEFCQDFHAMSAHSNYGYSQEFESLRRVGRKLTCYDAVLPENVSKNRYTNILPYDKTRVKLDSIDDELGSDYINANYVPGFSSPREYIACQGPLPGTVDDMWRMIWEMNVSVIVMATQLVEKGKVKCEQYWPEDHRPVFYGDIQVTMTTMNETESWNFRDFNLYKASVDQRKRVKHFNYLSWPDHGVPEDSLSILNFIEAVREAKPKDSSPMVVHCSAGCGRTGTFICLDQLLQQIEEFDYVNILGIASEMRAHRSHMIQTEQQYVFIHRCILDILEDNGLAPRPSSIMMNGNTGGALLMEMV